MPGCKRLTLGFDTSGDLGWLQASQTGVGYRNLALNLNGGNVGVGRTDPQDRLDVNGAIRVSTLGGGGSTTLCCNGSNQIAGCSSSLRYKQDIAPLALGMETVAQLRAVTFAWKDTGQRDLGLVAEEVNAVAPLLITRNAAGQIEGVKYDRLSAVLVKALQEQQSQIADLEARNTRLEARLAALEARSSAGSGPWPFAAGGLLAVGAVVVARRRGEL